jgi:uncharacterized membrane protein
VTTSGRARFALLVLLVLAFIGFSLPPYLTLDPARSRIAPPPDQPAYYPLLVAHVVFASLAMLTACLQMWPWLRRSHRVVHRAIGRIYVFAGVVPAGAAGLVIGAVSPFGPILRASNVLLAVLWLTCTLTGFRQARLGRLRQHRRHRRQARNPNRPASFAGFSAAAPKASVAHRSAFPCARPGDEFVPHPWGVLARALRFHACSPPTISAIDSAPKS